ncbi:helix-turn-helix domain-containing protein [Croceiramulus getboli]|nr:AraC family transcriptional regulator [Flavobacteriaceae bacterium YJPT1-3]
MRIETFQIPKTKKSSLRFQVDQAPFYDRLHQHREMQISWIVEGSGTLYLTDGVRPFASNDLFVFGSHQPHLLQSESSTALMNSVFFDKDALGNSFLQLEAGQELLHFYAFAKAGLRLSMTHSLKNRFNNLAKGNELIQLGQLFQLLHDIQKESFNYLSGEYPVFPTTEREGKRMQAIFDFTLSQYSQSISLKKVADIAAMTPPAFCKYFKKRTRKTYFEFLNEIRVNSACRLLQSKPQLPMTELALQCGFQSISQFNRVFKKQMGTSPRQYRSQN